MLVETVVQSIPSKRSTCCTDGRVEMGNTEWGALVEAQTSASSTVAGLRADVQFFKGDRDRLQDEVVELRAQMETPDHEDCSTEEVMRDGALMTVVWRRRERWSTPEVVAVYHGAYCLFTAVDGRDGDLEEAPRWALLAVKGALAVEQELPPRFMDVGCSRCGARFGPGNAGYSHCDQHQHRVAA